MTQFRYGRLTNEVQPGNYNITWNDQIFDPDSVVSGGVFTVPAGWDGKYFTLYYQERTTTVESGFQGFQWKPSGGSWALLNYTQKTAVNGISVSTGVLLGATGDQYRTYAGGTTTTQAEEGRTSFSGYLLGQPHTISESFKIRAATTQSAPDSTVTRLTNLTTVEWDDGGDTSGSVFIVPSRLNGGWGVFTSSMLSTSASDEDVNQFVSRSTNGGSSYVLYASGDITDGVGCIAISGVVPLVTGERWANTTYNTSSGLTVKADPISSLSGFVWK